MRGWLPTADFQTQIRKGAYSSGESSAVQGPYGVLCENWYCLEGVDRNSLGHFVRRTQSQGSAIRSTTPESEARDRRAAGLKRVFDAALAGAGLLASAPLWALFAAAIKLQDRGPVFYKQERSGQHGRRFDVLKFRSMIPQAEAGIGAVQASRSDPRVTAVGVPPRDRHGGTTSVWRGLTRATRSCSTRRCPQTGGLFLPPCELLTKPGAEGTREVHGCELSRRTRCSQ